MTKIVVPSNGKKYIEVIQATTPDQHLVYIYMDTEDFFFGHEKVTDIIASVEESGNTSTLNSYWRALSIRGLGICHVVNGTVTVLARDKNSNRTTKCYSLPVNLEKGYFPVIHFSGIESNSNMMREKIIEAVDIIQREPAAITNAAICQIDSGLVKMCKELRGDIFYTREIKKLIIKDIALLESIATKYEVMKATQTLSEANAVQYLRTLEAITNHRAKIGAIDTVLESIIECQNHIDKLHEIGVEIREAASAIRQL
jgi:hypothetical protein